MDVVLVCSLLIVFALFSGKLSSTIVTMPIAFSLIGYAIGPLEWLDRTQVKPYETVHLLAEATLALVLFAEASRVRLRRFSVRSNIAARLLLIALPASIALGAVLAFAIFPEGSLLIGLLTAAILAPTDAALAQPLFQSRDVPDQLRTALSVESGLNDGMVVPVILFAATAVAAGMATPIDSDLARHLALSTALPALVGAVLGPVVAKAIAFCRARDWMEGAYEGAAIIALVAALYTSAEALGGSGFIATFAGGVAFGAAAPDRCGTLEAFMEREGQILSIATFIIFGAVLVPLAIEHASARTVTLAICFLTIVRLLPVLISTAGLGLGWSDRLLLGWFGPRGLPSIIFVLLVLQEHAFLGSQELLSCVVMTVALSIAMHGMSSAPITRYFAARQGAGQTGRFRQGGVLPTAREAPDALSACEPAGVAAATGFAPNKE